MELVLWLFCQLYRPWICTRCFKVIHEVWSSTDDWVCYPGRSKDCFLSDTTHRWRPEALIYIAYRHFLSILPHCLSSRLLLFLWLRLSDLSSTSNCSGCLDVTLYSEEISRLKREFEDIQRMILGQEQVLWHLQFACFVQPKPKDI